MKSPCSSRAPKPAACCATRCRSTGLPSRCWTARWRSSAAWASSSCSTRRIGSDLSLDDLSSKFDATFLSHRHLEGNRRPHSRQRAAGRVSRAATSSNARPPAGQWRSASTPWSSAAATRRSIAPARRSARARRRPSSTVASGGTCRRSSARSRPPRQEGVRFLFLAAPHRIIGERGAVKSIEVMKTRLGEFDTSGRRRPIDTGEIRVISCSSVILAVGEGVETDFYAGLRPDHQGKRHARGRSLHAGDQPRERVCRWRPDRRASNVSRRDGLRQGSGEEHRSSA